MVERIMAGDRDLIDFIQRGLGMSLAGVVREHVLFVAWGRGANGKSTLLNAVADVLGPDYAMKAAPDLLMVRKQPTHPTERADLFGKRLVLAIETEDGSRFSEATVKELTGGDPVRARRMHEDFWQFNPTHHIWLACNHKPTVRGTDNGIWRRLRLVPFTVEIPEAEQDRALPEKLRAEAPGILTWLVRGCLDWQENGLGEPASVREATKEYRDTQDVLAAFIADCCDLGPFRSKASALYACYSKWAETAGEYVLSQTRFSLAVEQRGFPKERSNGSWYLGISPKERF